MLTMKQQSEQSNPWQRFNKLMFYISLGKNEVILETFFQANLTKKLNLTQQKQTTQEQNSKIA